MKIYSNEEWVELQCSKTSREDLHNHRDQIFYLMECHDNKKKLMDSEIRSMFETRNHYMPAPEYGYWCSSCRASCYKTLLGILPIIIKHIDKDGR